MQTIEYKGFEIKLMVDEFADSPLDNQTLPIGFLAEYVKRVESGVNDTHSILFGKIDIGFIYHHNTLKMI